MQSTERWLPVVGYEGIYEVSDHGRVRSLARVVRGRFWPERILKPQVSYNGYLRVPLCRDNTKIRYSIHRLVLENFVRPCPDGMEACHNNGVRDDNRLTNLRWDTHSENSLDVVRHNRHHEALRTHCPRGHALVEPNLVKAQSMIGKRKCRSCANGSSATRKVRARMSVTEAADAWYERLMGGALVD